MAQRVPIRGEAGTGYVLDKGFDMKDAFGNTLKGTADGVLINGFLIKLSGDAVTKHGTDVDTHVHTKVTTGNDNTGPPP